MPWYVRQSVTSDLKSAIEAAAVSALPGSESGYSVAIVSMIGNESCDNDAAFADSVTS